MSRVEARWGRRTEFAEVAEVVGVSTDQIVGMGTIDGSTVSVMFTREIDRGDELPIFGALLRRDADRVLRLLTEPEIVTTWGELIAEIEG